jgi:sugar phosphate isomerase/epimerase
MPDYSNETIRIGTLVHGGPDAPAYIEKILPHGFESFSITWFNDLGNTNLRKLAKDVNRVLEGTGASISSLGMFCNPLTDGERGKLSRKCWRQVIDNAHHFGTDLVCGFAGRVVDEPIDKSMKQFKKVYGNLAKRAADKGVRIAFENCDMGGTWDRGDWNIAHNPTAWEMMFDAVPADNIGLEWEPCHQMVSLIDPIPQLRRWAPKMFHIHGKDATVMWDVVREYGVHGPKPFAYHRTPGFGDSNWTDIISILRLNGFEGAIDIEGWHDPVYRGDLEMTGQVRALNYLKDCRGGSYVENP